MSNTTSVHQFLIKDTIRAEQELNTLLLHREDGSTPLKRTKPKIRKATTADQRVFGQSGTPYISESNIKLSQSGRYLRVKSFPKPKTEKTIKRNKPTKTKSNRSNTNLVHDTPEWYERKQYRNRKQADNRARDTFIDTSRANYRQSTHKYSFATRSIRVSYATLPKDRKQMYRWLEDSKLRFRKLFGYKLDMLVVDEYGDKNGRLHQHIEAFNAPFLSNEFWHKHIFIRGYVKVTTCYSPNVAVYNAKYFSKDFNKKGKHTRRYSSTKGLKRPSKVLGIHNQNALLKEKVEKGYYIKEVIGVNPYTQEIIKWQIWIPPDEWDTYKLQKGTSR